MSVRVIHGANDVCYEVSGETVGRMRRALRDTHNIPDDARATVGESPVSDEHILVDGDHLHFARIQGKKGLGRLLAPDELQKEWQISREDYEHLLILSLPMVRLSANQVRHPESAVDEFYRQLGNPSRMILPDLVGSRYIADQLDCTTVWVTMMTRQGRIPASCVASGSGNGKPWKFVRVRIDAWLRTR